MTNTERIKALIGSWKESLFTKHELIADKEDYEALKQLVQERDAYRKALERIANGYEPYGDEGAKENYDECRELAQQALEGGGVMLSEHEKQRLYELKEQLITSRGNCNENVYIEIAKLEEKMTDNNEELKPCPFCDDNAELYSSGVEKTMLLLFFVNLVVRSHKLFNQMATLAFFLTGNTLKKPFWLGTPAPSQPMRWGMLIGVT